MNDKVLKGFDKGVMTDVILIDHQKAFDKIEYDELLENLSAIGFSKHTFNSYLSNRSVLVHLENNFFQPEFISRGVPHGSILAPLLFLIHTNDMSQINKCYLFLYADDSGLNFEHKDFNETEKQLN